jgi:two-component sensor histidine kinase
MAHDDTVILAEWNHRLFNTFQVLVNAIERYQRQGCGEATKVMLLDLETRLHAFAQLYYLLAAPRLDGDFEDRCRTLCGLLVRAFGREDVRPCVVMEKLTLTDGQAFRLALLVVELVTNVLKHSLADGPGVVWVDLRARGGQIELSVSDSRKEPVALFAPSRIVQALAQALDGEAFVIDNAGCVAGVRMPAAPTMEILPLRGRQRCGGRR